MTVSPGSVLVLVCHQCGKKYKGDPSKPDARYECPVDQSTLIRLDLQAIAAVRQARSEASRPQPTKREFSDAAMPDTDGVGFSQDDVPTQSPYTQSFNDQDATRLLTSTENDQATVKIPHPEASRDARQGQEKITRELTMSYGETSTETPTKDFSSMAIPEQKLQTQPQPQPAQSSSISPTASGFVPMTMPTGTELLNGFEQRRSVVAALERMGGTDPETGRLIPVYKSDINNKLAQPAMAEAPK